MDETLYTAINRFLCPAGDGVYTVSTGTAYKQQLQHTLYQATGQTVQNAWQQQLKSFTPNTKPCLLGICCDSGGGILRGANWGPLFIRNALYEIMSPNQVMDLGDVRIIPQLLLDDYHSDNLLQQCRIALYGEPQPYPVSPLSITEHFVATLLASHPQQTLLSFGGDHSVSYALIKPYLFAKQNIKTAIVHFDAHTDLLPHRLGVPVCFGSWTSHILPLLEDPSHLIQLGIRATKKSKLEWEKNLGIKQFWADEINAMSVDSLCEQLLNYLSKRNIQELYVTVDIDVLDNSAAAATGTPEPGGLDPNTLKTVIKVLGQSFKISGADIMEVAPFSIPPNTPKREDEPKRTLFNAASIAQSLCDVL